MKRNLKAKFEVNALQNFIDLGGTQDFIYELLLHLFLNTYLNRLL